MRLRLRLERAAMLSPAVRSLVFEVTPARKGEGSFSYEPGHYLDLFVPTRGLAAKRSYSIASAPGAHGPGRVELAISRVEGGPSSTALHELAVGATLDAEGPRGSFLRWPQERDLPTLFVATGSGLAPLRAMLQAELARNDGPPLALLFGVRATADVLWKEELETWARDRPRFSLMITLSRDPYAPRRGHVQQHLADAVERVHPSRVFVCGLSPMVEAVTAALPALGIPSDVVRSETYDT